MDAWTDPAERALLERHAALFQKMQRLREAAVSRLVASVAQDVRSSVANIVYSADLLDVRGAAMESDMLRETVHDISEASQRLQLTVDGLLDYAKVGPAIAVPVSLFEVITRAHGVLRSLYRDGSHRLRVELTPGAEWLRGNPVLLEQIFVNVLLASAECASRANVVSVGTVTAADTMVHVVISGDGDQAMPAPPDGVGALEGLSAAYLALLDASSAAQSQGGQLHWHRVDRSLRFTLRLPRSEGPR